MRIRSMVYGGLLVLMLAGCGKTSTQVSELQGRNEELTKRVAKLEDDLHEAKRQLIAQQQALQTMNERLRTAEMGIDKLAYQASR